MPGPSPAVQWCAARCSRARKPKGRRAAAFLATRVIGLEPRAQPVGGKLARGVVGKAERIGDRRAEQRIAERVQDQGEGALRDMMLFVANAQLRDQVADRIRGSG